MAPKHQLWQPLHRRLRATVRPSSALGPGPGCVSGRPSAPHPERGAWHAPLWLPKCHFANGSDFPYISPYIYIYIYMGKWAPQKSNGNGVLFESRVWGVYGDRPHTLWAYQFRI